MSDLERHLARLRELLPDQPFGRARPIDEGERNAVLVLDERLIARFPRDAAGVAALRWEAALLGALPELPVAIPRPLLVALDPPLPGAAVMLYPRIPGEQLSIAAAGSLPEAALARITGQLAAFLRALHALDAASLASRLPTGVAPRLAYGFPGGAWDDGWAAFAAELLAACGPLLAPAARDAFARRVDAFRAGWRRAAPPLVVVHADFGTVNLLHDPAAGTLTGAIDFGSAGLGDPALDIAALASYGERFLGLVARGYPALDSLRERAAFYRASFPLQEAAHQLAQGDEQEARAVLAKFVG